VDKLTQEIDRIQYLTQSNDFTVGHLFFRYDMLLCLPGLDASFDRLHINNQFM